MGFNLFKKLYYFKRERLSPVGDRYKPANTVVEPVLATGNFFSK